MLHSLYEADFHRWATKTAQLLKAGQLHELDLDNLVAVIEDVGKTERRVVESQIEQLLHHLLKWQHQPGSRGSSWKGSIQEARQQTLRQLKRNPSLKDYLGQVLADSYDIGRIRAIAETGLSEAIFPETCPYPLRQVLDEDFFPER